MLNRHRELHKLDNVGWLRAAVLGANDGIVSTGWHSGARFRWRLRLASVLCLELLYSREKFLREELAI
jgi:hypothetical protein